jgi:hypothetical protein
LGVSSSIQTHWAWKCQQHETRAFHGKKDKSLMI